MTWIRAGLVLWMLVCFLTGCTLAVGSGYRLSLLPHPDGIGKVYQGREIAQVMGHEGAYWLERPQRAWEERPHAVIEALHLKSTDVVADIGAGTGYFTFRLSPLVGKVLAVDVQPEMLALMRLVVEQESIPNVELVLGNETDPQLTPNSIDLALLVDVYHEFAYPREMMSKLGQALKPNGRVVLVEYRKEDPRVAIKALHKMSVAQAKRELATVGLVWQETQEFLPEQHVLIFKKPDPASSP